MNVPMKNLFVGREEQIEKIELTILSLYKTLVTEQLPRLLDTINISKIVESRINEMDVKESEKLILEVMNRELKAIVWLGALHGFVMGCIRLFIRICLKILLNVLNVKKELFTLNWMLMKWRQCRVAASLCKL